MAHSPPELSKPDPFSQSKTLFISAPCKAGVLVIHQGSKMKSVNRRFTGPHDAVDWCLANHAGMVLAATAPDPRGN